MGEYLKPYLSAELKNSVLFNEAGKYVGWICVGKPGLSVLIALQRAAVNSVLNGRNEQPLGEKLGQRKGFRYYGNSSGVDGTSLLASMFYDSSKLGRRRASR